MSTTHCRYSRLLLLAALLCLATAAYGSTPYQTVSFGNTDEAMIALYPDINHVGVDCSFTEDGKVLLRLTSTVPWHQNFSISVNGRAPSIIDGNTWLFRPPADMAELVIRSQGPLAAIGQEATVTLQPNGDFIDISMPPEERQPIVPTYAWQWDEPGTVRAAAVRECFTSETELPEDRWQRCLELTRRVRDYVAGAMVADNSLLTPVPLLPDGGQHPSPRQLATTLVAAAWSFGQPARLVIFGADQSHFLVEFFLPEVGRGKWVLVDPLTATGFFHPNYELLAAVQLAALATSNEAYDQISQNGAPLSIGSQQALYAAFALQNNFCSTAWQHPSPPALTLMVYQPPVDEYAALKTWSERIGGALFIIALLGIAGIKLLSPDEEEDAEEQDGQPSQGE